MWNPTSCSNSESKGFVADSGAFYRSSTFSIWLNSLVKSNARSFLQSSGTISSIRSIRAATEFKSSASRSLSTVRILTDQRGGFSILFQKTASFHPQGRCAGQNSQRRPPCYKNTAAGWRRSHARRPCGRWTAHSQRWDGAYTPAPPRFAH